MIQTIVALVLASGILGLCANFLVNGVKKLAELQILWQINPRVWAAAISLVMAILTILSGGDVNVNDVSMYLEILFTAGMTWLIAHLTHTTNST